MFTIFLIAFGIGAGFVLISFFIGEFSGEIEADSSFAFLKPSLVSSFLVVFGLVGIILDLWLSLEGPLAFVTLGLAFFAGFFSSIAMNNFILIPLKKLENTSAADLQELVGMEAKVIEKIPQGGYGKITFTVNGNKHNAAAKAEDSNQIERYALVEIIYIEKSTYYVRAKEK